MKVHERDKMYMGVLVPTDYRIARLACALDTEQDPEMWSCTVIGQELPGGAVVGTTLDFDETEDFEVEINQWATNNDYNIV